jgi:capsular polysaccharide transport system ATP-binding protein
MIILERVTSVVTVGGKTRKVLAAASEKIPSNRHIALLGPSHEDNRILINLLGGVELPTDGYILRKALVSFPVGHLGGFQRDQTVRLNVAHVARLYGADVQPTVNFVRKVANLGKAFNKPYIELPTVQKKELSELLAFSIPFDLYLLLDEIALPGTRRFHETKHALFEARARTSGMIVAVRDLAFARKYCNMGLVLNRGRLRLFDDVARAISAVEKLKAKATAASNPRNNSSP